MREYATFLNSSVGGEHICIASLEEELAALPGRYSEPAGAILLALAGDEPAGCVALRPLTLSAPPSSDQRTCEMKRLWVRPAYQGTGLGRLLAQSILDAARQRSYTAMLLDTMPRTMQSAYALYLSMGFTPVERYAENPVLRHADSIEVACLRKEL